MDWRPLERDLSTIDQEKYFRAGSLDDFKLEEKESKCTPIKIPDSQRRINLVNHRNKLYAVQNTCPHQGAPLHQGSIGTG